MSKKPYTFGTTKSVCIFGTVSYSFRPPYRRKEERRSRPSNRHSGRRLTRCIVRRSRSSPREPETVCYSPFIQKREKSTYEYLGFTKHVRKKNISQKREKSPNCFYSYSSFLRSISHKHARTHAFSYAHNVRHFCCPRCCCCFFLSSVSSSSFFARSIENRRRISSRIKSLLFERVSSLLLLKRSLRETLRNRERNDSRVSLPRRRRRRRRGEYYYTNTRTVFLSPFLRRVVSSSSSSSSTNSDVVFCIDLYRDLLCVITVR